MTENNWLSRISPAGIFFCSLRSNFSQLTENSATTDQVTTYRADFMSLDWKVQRGESVFFIFIQVPFTITLSLHTRPLSIRLSSVLKTFAPDTRKRSKPWRVKWRDRPLIQWKFLRGSQQVTRIIVARTNRARIFPSLSGDSRRVKSGEIIFA